VSASGALSRRVPSSAFELLVLQIEKSAPDSPRPRETM
jgi:hypothetical protein